MSIKAKEKPETDAIQQGLTRLQEMLQEAETEILRHEQVEREAYDALLHAQQAKLGGNSTGDIVELRVAYQTAQGETQIIRDLLQRLRGDLVMAQNRADLAQQADERAEKVAEWNALADEHLAYLGQFEQAVEALRVSLEGMYQVGLQQKRLAALLLDGPAQSRVNHSHFKTAYLDAFLSMKLGVLLPRLRTGFNSASDALKVKKLEALSPFARKLS